MLGLSEVACSGFHVVDNGEGDAAAIDATVDVPGADLIGLDIASDKGSVYRDLPSNWLTDARAENGLHPALMISPAITEQVCTYVGSPTAPCTEGDACAFYTSEEDRCATCPVEKCENFNNPCSPEKPCRPFYTCFGGFCTVACPLNSRDICGNPDDCLEIGHPTHGVCARLSPPG